MVYLWYSRELMQELSGTLQYEIINKRSCFENAACLSRVS